MLNSFDVIPNEDELIIVFTPEEMPIIATIEMIENQNEHLDGEIDYFMTPTLITLNNLVYRDVYDMDPNSKWDYLNNYINLDKNNIPIM